MPPRMESGSEGVAPATAAGDGVEEEEEEEGVVVVVVVVVAVEGVETFFFGGIMCIWCGLLRRGKGRMF